MKRLWLLVLGLCLLSACTPKTVISKTYNFGQVRRIGIMRFSSAWSSMQGVENLFAKYFISAGFKVVERAQLESILQEHNISVSGYLSPETTKEIGKILGVDLLLIGEVSSYSPSRTELTMTTVSRGVPPVYTQDVMRMPDGTYVGYQRRISPAMERTELRPTTYTIDACVGIIAKLVDVESAEIVWIGSNEASTSSDLEAADSVARGLVKSFTKELTKLEQKKNEGNAF